MPYGIINAHIMYKPIFSDYFKMNKKRMANFFCVRIIKFTGISSGKYGKKIIKNILKVCFFEIFIPIPLVKRVILFVLVSTAAIETIFSFFCSLNFINTA